MTRRTVRCSKPPGFRCEVVGGAGTGTFELEAASGVYTELQAGSYCFMDADYARNKRADGGRFDTFEHALFVYATVMSTPVAERAVVDAGLKAFSFDAGAAGGGAGSPAPSTSGPPTSTAISTSRPAMSARSSATRCC